MNRPRAQLIIGAICVLLGLTLVTQFRTQREARQDLPFSVTDQATYLSQLYDSNNQLRQQVAELSRELDQYRSDSAGGKSSLDSLMRDLQDLRMASGTGEAVGPGVTVLVQGNLTVFELQDLVNELRNAAAEAIAVNGIRVVARSAIVGDESGAITVERQHVSSPYRLEAVGNPDTLAPALERKGGLVALLRASDANLRVDVTRHEIRDQADRLRLAPTRLTLDMSYARPEP